MDVSYQFHSFSCDFLLRPCSGLLLWWCQIMDLLLRYPCTRLDLWQQGVWPGRLLPHTDCAQSNSLLSLTMTMVSNLWRKQIGMYNKCYMSIWALFLGDPSLILHLELLYAGHVFRIGLMYEYSTILANRFIPWIQGWGQWRLYWLLLAHWNLSTQTCQKMWWCSGEIFWAFTPIVIGTVL